MILNRGQQAVVDAAVYWYYNSSKQVFQFAGDPGTGKSVVLNTIRQKLNIPLERIAPMSFIGAAAIVMRMKGLTNAKTIHSTLFTPAMSYKTDIAGNLIKNDYFNRPLAGIEFIPKPLDDIDLIIIDEAYAVPYSLKKEIESRGIKVLACGDSFQLAPVKDKPAYLYDDDVMVLDEIVRQAENSSIIYLSQRAKHGLPIHCGFYGDALVIEEDDVTDVMMANSDVILCGKNVTRDNMNKYIRNDIFNINYDIPTYGEKLVCRKNNWNIELDGINLANGLTGRVSSYPDVGSFDGKTFKINFKPDLLQSSFPSLSCDYNYFTAPYEKKLSIKNDKYSIGEKFEYGYALTTHLSQGSQYNYGMYYEEYLNPDMNNRLNFTGITRFSKGLIYVKKKKRYY